MLFRRLQSKTSAFTYSIQASLLFDLHTLDVLGFDDSFRAAV